AQNVRWSTAESQESTDEIGGKGRQGRQRAARRWTSGSPGATAYFCRGGRPRRTPSVAEGNLYRHPILCHHRLLEHLARLLHQLLGTNRVPRGDVRQDESPSLGRQRDLRRFARRRMPRLLGPLLLLLPKRRLVNQ